MVESPAPVGTPLRYIEWSHLHAALSHLVTIILVFWKFPVQNPGLCPPPCRTKRGSRCMTLNTRTTHPNSLIHNYTPEQHSHYRLLPEEFWCTTESNAMEKTDMMKWLRRWCPWLSLHMSLPCSRRLTAWELLQPPEGRKAQRSLYPISQWPWLL